jgi:hypothetical protein
VKKAFFSKHEYFLGFEKFAFVDRKERQRKRRRKESRVL